MEREAATPRLTGARRPVILCESGIVLTCEFGLLTGWVPAELRGDVTMRTSLTNPYTYLEQDIERHGEISEAISRPQHRTWIGHRAQS